MIGAVALLIGYGLVTTSRLSGDGVAYQAINLGGALTLAINSGYHGAWPSVILNVVWTGIGALAIGKFIAKRAGGRAAKGA
ncbi:hypothetical protein Aph01nite_39040 [Acrocarpospora phusangensis]|uniref:CBU-0592-like domain-containing protein n=1 Tax=Acrocarpospora phusangensis TaxID=1070424 RepID=A0A919UL28_9ACTN|nr:hypothetical protein [Acrocarpospora phusangensis]GIH25594.1 hypothetical protein Aph01nite_39040 [Acrocarpospora phusangensis]